MDTVRRLFYTMLFHCFVRNKHQRKNLCKCFSKVGIGAYFQLRRLCAKEAVGSSQFKYFIAIACIIKNESPYLREWIEYHKLIGIEHFYVYDNESSDGTLEVLQPYIDSGLVTYIFFPGYGMQDSAYCHAVKSFGAETKWMAVVDLDEFIVLHQKSNLREFMEEYNGCAQISLHWVSYGSSGHKKQPKGLVLENFRSHAASPVLTPKSIFNPRVAVDCGAHYMYVCGLWVNENHEKFGSTSEFPINKCQINHYEIKSEEEFYNKKVTRGRSSGTSTFGEDLRRYFNERDHNEITDNLMMPYVARLKAMGIGTD